MDLNVLPEPLAICRLPASARIPSWALELHEAFSSITRTQDELSIVCPEDAVPDDVQVEPGWRALAVPGPIPFEVTGMLARIAAPLAAARISIFAISTYDTDYVLVRAGDVDAALRVLAAAEEPTVTRISGGSPFEAEIGFSRAIRRGDRILVSGTGPREADGGCAPTTLEQARRAWEIVVAALREAGAGPEHVIRTRTFLTPEADAEQAGAAHAELFADVRPASTMLRVHSLLDPRWVVEVEAEAAR